MQGVGPKLYTMTYTDETKGSEHNSNAIGSASKCRIGQEDDSFKKSGDSSAVKHLNELLGINLC